jgi:TonB-dependent SusC/RagA subfamily outer membrane receptor
MKNLRLPAFLILSLLLLYPVSSSGQKANKKFTITGKVTDAGNRPIQNAVIFIDKVKTTSVTDHQGIYKIRVKPDAVEILVFTLLNGAAETGINGRTTIDFVLTGAKVDHGAGDNAADDESVSVGYGSLRKKDASVQSNMINGQDPSFASAQTIYDMIRGRVPGVEVSGTSIKVMGSSSLVVSSEPLFVVDGVIVKSIDNISPQTVKTIEVLKGPAASVYGTRGANGVILINLLTGKDK